MYAISSNLALPKMNPTPLLIGRNASACLVRRSGVADGCTVRMCFATHPSSFQTAPDDPAHSEHIHLHLLQLLLFSSFYFIHSCPLETWLLSSFVYRLMIQAYLPLFFQSLCTFLRKLLLGIRPTMRSSTQFILILSFLVIQNSRSGGST